MPILARGPNFLNSMGLRLLLNKVEKGRGASREVRTESDSGALPYSRALLLTTEMSTSPPPTVLAYPQRGRALTRVAHTLGISHAARNRRKSHTDADAASAATGGYSRAAMQGATPRYCVYATQ